ncbi:MAG: CoA pyrophosphatase [Desulfobacterales bacterium]|nr:CoA pyrophosphatase [Desulfobacterales bacterium]
MLTFNGVSDTIRTVDFPYFPIIGDPKKKASVFLLVFNESEPKILCILKSENKNYAWSNQVALPGGHIDDEDSSPLDAAFRELKEEVNISMENVEYISSMGHFETINRTDIEAFVGIWNGIGEIQFDKNEISKIITPSLKDLAKIHINNNFYKRNPSIYELIYNLEGVSIWGVTARILHSFIEVILLDK